MLKSVRRAPRAPPNAGFSLFLTLLFCLSHLFRFCCCQELPAAVQAKAKVKNAQKADQNSHTCDSVVVSRCSILLTESCSSLLPVAVARRAMLCVRPCGKKHAWIFYTTNSGTVTGAELPVFDLVFTSSSSIPCTGVDWGRYRQIDRHRQT